MHDNGNASTVFSVKQANWCLFFVLLGFILVEGIQFSLAVFLRIQPDILVAIVLQTLALAPVVIFAISSGRRAQALRFVSPGGRNMLSAVLLAFFIYLIVSVALTFLSDRVR